MGTVKFFEVAIVEEKDGIVFVGFEDMDNIAVKLFGLPAVFVLFDHAAMEVVEGIRDDIAADGGQVLRRGFFLVCEVVVAFFVIGQHFPHGVVGRPFDFLKFFAFDGTADDDIFDEDEGFIEVEVLAPHDEVDRFEAIDFCLVSEIGDAPVVVVP